MILTKDQILSVNDLKTETVEVKEWGGSVLIRTFTGAERDAFEASLYDETSGEKKLNLNGVRARLVAMTIVDENGNRLFNDDEVSSLGKKSAAALDRVFEVAQRLNGLSRKDVDELAKN